MTVADVSVLMCLRAYRFLLKSSAAKVISLNKAELNISFSCATTLIRGLELFCQSAAPSERLMQIASSTHRLLPYALEYWTEHCLRYAASCGSLEPGSLLPRRLSELENKHSSFLQTFRGGELASPRPLESSNECPPDDRLKCISHLPIQHLIDEVLHVRSIAGQQCCENGEGKLNPVCQRFCRPPRYMSQ